MSKSYSFCVFFSVFYHFFTLIYWGFSFFTKEKKKRNSYLTLFFPSSLATLGLLGQVTMGVFLMLVLMDGYRTWSLGHVVACFFLLSMSFMAFILLLVQQNVQVYFTNENLYKTYPFGKTLSIPIKDIILPLSKNKNFFLPYTKLGGKPVFKINRLMLYNPSSMKVLKEKGFL